MTDYTILQYLPLVSMGVWWSLAVYQVARDRFRTWTEMFFLGQCLFIGAYSFSDVLFFTAGRRSEAFVAALLSFSCLTLASVFVMLFGVVFYTRMRRILFVTILPALAVLPVLWVWLIPPDLTVGLWSLQCPIPAQDGTPQIGCPTLGPPWIGNWNQPLYLVWILLVFGYVLIGSVALYFTYREVARHTTKLRRRMQGLLVSALAAIVISVATNAFRGVFHVTFLPLFSSALALPGVVSWMALSPLSKERLSVAVRRWKAHGYSIKMALVLFHDGTLIGAETQPGEKVIDKDVFGATLDVIQNFMRTSFPALRGKWLQSIRVGDYTLVAERGRVTYLVLVIQGQETDQLRRQMRDAILEYESDNSAALARWRGVPTDAAGTDDLLLAILEGE